MRRFWLGLLLALIIGVIYSWLQAPEWLENWNQEHQQMIEQQRQAGVDRGELTDQQGCLDNALERLKNCKGTEYQCTVGGGMFLKSCWSKSGPTEHFCQGIPQYNETATEDDKAWVKDRCFELGIDAKGCRLMLRQQQQICSPQ
mgnify:CR=1 FL=1